MSALCPTIARSVKPPSSRAPLPRAGVTVAGKTCPVFWEDVTPPSLLLWAHAPILLSHLSFGLSLVRDVFAGCHQPRLLAGPSRRYSANLSLVARSPATAVPSSARACLLPRCHRPAPGNDGSASRFDPRTQLSVGRFSRLQTFRYVQAPKFVRPPGCSHRYGYAVGRPRLLHPGRTCFVTSARTGHTSRPKSGN